MSRRMLAFAALIAALAIAPIDSAIGATRASETILIPVSGAAIDWLGIGGSGQVMRTVFRPCLIVFVSPADKARP